MRTTDVHFIGNESGPRAFAAMAHYRSKREQFRRYLEKTGVLDSLTNVLVALYEETEKPSNALEYPFVSNRDQSSHASVSFIKHQLGVAGPEGDEVDSLRLELNDLQQKYDALAEENKELRGRLLRYEPAQDEGNR
ncbi:hypothetical protein DNTS_008396 [Danionella cerebrum]|uniref:c-Myc-binding protein n=1 Tax=Danionella cerebrum TaxID=2873325 RepID=A0A553MTS2_9TELE|nr:hypothetical protein DNTS_008396 [Danionella translucida]TRY56564.1 hypothetical protein DNTS_008396 [Danionella translucida]